MEQKKLESAKDLLDTLIGMVDDNHHSDYDGALKVGIECIDRVQELELRNTELSNRLDALDLLLDWAIECNFDFDSLGDAYEEFKGEVFDMDSHKESMIKIAECYIEKYGDERWH